MSREATPLRGLTLLKKILGRKLLHIVRYVLGFSKTNDPSGHGITELHFEEFTISVRPGPNEDFIIIEEGEAVAADLNLSYWSKHDLASGNGYADYIGKKLQRVELYTDGLEDIALVFHFEENREFSIVLDDTDLCLTRDFNPLTPLFDGTVPQLRAILQKD